MQNPTKLRQLALWYREFAERAGNPVIWESRLLMAQDLEEEAERIEAANPARNPSRAKPGGSATSPSRAAWSIPGVTQGQNCIRVEPDAAPPIPKSAGASNVRR